jgi:nucleoside-diphosphate-sugar epimerase
MRQVAPRLIEQGHEVRGVDNFMRYGHSQPPEGIEFIEGDLTDPATVRRALTEIEGIVQSAAQIYGVVGFHRYPADILQRDTLLHGLILREAVAQGVRRVVYISSSMVYERSPAVAEEPDVPDVLVPHTDYGLSKLVGERLSQAFAVQYGLEYTIWRPFNLIGLQESATGQDPGVSHVFADFIERIVRQEQNPVLILGGGQQVRCFTWIDDVADAIAEHSFTAVTRNQDFNLGNPEPVTMLELAERIYRLYHEMQGREPGEPLRFVHGPTFADDVQVRIPSIRKAREVLGWQPRVHLDEMLSRCIAPAVVSRQSVGAPREAPVPSPVSGATDNWRPITEDG